LQVLLALATYFNWEIEQMDVKTAFLHPVLKEEIFMAIPEGYAEYSNMPHPDSSHLVLRLLKALYGLQQAPPAWYNHITKFLLHAGMSHSNEDHSLFFSNSLIVVIYIDDLLLFARDMDTIKRMNTAHSTTYHMTDLGPITQFLSLQIVQERPQYRLDLY